MEAFGNAGNVSDIVLSDMPKMVFIVEDDPSLRTLYEEMLDDEGLRGFSFSSSNEALEMLSGYTPRALVTDVDGLGEMNGLKLAQTLRERRHDLPVLVVSGGTHEAEARGLNLSYLPKPARLAEIVDKLKALLSTEQMVPA